jgi:hypothetical protein
MPKKDNSLKVGAQALLGGVYTPFHQVGLIGSCAEI